jgi:enoyl-CoA hydratase
LKGLRFSNNELIKATFTIDVDKDKETNVAIICGAGKGFCAGGDFDMVEKIINDYEMQVEALREFRDLCYNIIN